MPKCHNQILFHYADILWAAIHRDHRDCVNFLVPAKFQKYLKHISWVMSGTSSSKLSCNPRHPSWNISCNHRHHLLQPSWRRIFSTSNNQKTRVDSDINSDYKASSFDKLYNWCRKWNTADFVRAHTEISKCAHHRPRPCWRWLQLQLRFPPVIMGIILCMCSANERQGYNTMSSLIGWSHIQNDPQCYVLAATGQ